MFPSQVVGVGIDLECIERFSFVRKPGGRAFYQRVYIPAEQAAYGTELELLARGFTAKEAVAKVLGRGLSLCSSAVESVACQEIEILSGDNPDEPIITLRGKALAVATALSIATLVLCWHHNQRLACSVVAGITANTVTAELRSRLTQALRCVLEEQGAY